MSDYVSVRIDARKRLRSAAFDVQTAELRYGRGSEEWLHACKLEHAAMVAYDEAARRERATSPF